MAVDKLGPPLLKEVFFGQEPPPKLELAVSGVLVLLRDTVDDTIVHVSDFVHKACVLSLAAAFPPPDSSLPDTPAYAAAFGDGRFRRHASGHLGLGAEPCCFECAAGDKVMSDEGDVRKECSDLRVGKNKG
jgi:hypothetical protein